MSRFLAQRAGLRYFTLHPWLTALSVAGIALGVAVVVAIDLANASAQRAFELSAARVAGRTTHQVVASEAVPGDVYRTLRIDAGLRFSAPVVEGYVVRAGRSYQLLGVDPFADRPFRPYVTDLSELDLGAFMGAEPVVLAPASIGASAGDTLHVSIAGEIEVLTVGAVLEAQDEMSRAAIDNLLIADVGTAQSLFAMGDRLSRIDLILNDEAEAARVEAVLPPGTRLVRSDARTAAVDRMTAAFELNLNALSLLALVVAMFLIYNTMTFSVVQRRTLLGRLRAIGLTRREVFRQILLEAALLGAAGVVVGLLVGIGLAQGLVRMVTQTINDLYYVLEVRSVSIEPLVLAKAAALGMAATAAAAVVPAREAASAPVHVVLQRSEEETTMRSRLPLLSAAGAFTTCAAVLLLAVSGRNLILSYAGLFLILAGFALLAPAATMWAARGARRLLGVPFGLVGRMAAQGIVHNLSRTSVAIAALTIAVAASVGVGVMVGSFRDTVVDWLDYTLQADLYVRPPSSAFRLGQSNLPENALLQLGTLPGVRAAASVRRLDLLLSGGRIELAAIDPGPSGAESYRFTSGDPARIWERFTENASVLVSEPLAYRTGMGAGDSLELPTDRGLERFPVAGIFYDYGSDQGAALMTRSTFMRHFDAAGLSGISLYLDPGSDPAQVADLAREVVDGDVIVRSNRALREASMDVFDRTFAITTVLQVLSLLVAFAGVLSALMALQIERAGEFAILRAEGMTPGLLRRYVLLQTSLMGAISGLLALPLGLVLSYVLIFVINKRSFGWTLHFSAPVEVLLQAVLLAGAAALLAGIYPSVALSRTDLAGALRSE